MSAGAHAVTAAGVLADDEERWFDDLSVLMQEYLDEYGAWVHGPRSEKDWRSERVHEAKRAVIDRFYAMGWERL
jgi:hypothetical protein